MTDVPLSGEAREKIRRRKFWTVLGGIAVVAAPIGGIFGFKVGQSIGRGGDMSSAIADIPGWAFIFVAAISALSLIVGTWRFAKVIDEVELADNLWGSAAAYYAYVIIFPSWWLLWLGGVTREPIGWAIFFLSLIAGLAAYLLRKIGR